jgi:tape measure domain-containing protein
MANFADLTVELELKQNAFNKGMSDAAKQLAKVSTSAGKSQKSLQSIEKTMEAVGQAAAALASSFAAIKSLEGIAKASQQLNDLKGSFTALLGSSGRATDMMDRVFGIVARTGVPLEAAGASMQRLSIAMQAMGASNQQIETVAETFIQLGKVGGSSIAETAGALTQLGQALASGHLGGDELKSISENAPLVAQAIAEAMGKTMGEMKSLGEEGKLTSDVVGNALIRAASKASAAFRELPQSLEQATNKMEAQATQAAAAFDKVSGTTSTLVTTVQFIADMLARWTSNLEETHTQLNGVQLTAELVGDIVRIIAAGFVAAAFGAESIVRWIGAVAAELERLLALDWQGVLDASARFHQELDASAESAERTIRALLKMQQVANANADAAAVQSRGAAKPQPGDLKPPPGTGAGGGKGDPNKEADAIKKRGEALAASLDAQIAYNQKVAEYDLLLGHLAISQDTWEKAMQKAKEELTSVGDALTASVDPAFAYEVEMRKINQAYRDGAIEVETWVKLQEKAKEAMEAASGKGKEKTFEDQVKDLQEAMSQAIASDVGQFFTDMITGAESAAKAFEKMAKQIITDLGKLLAEFAAKQASQFIIKSLFSTAGGASAGGASAGGQSLMLASMPAVTWNPARSLSVSPLAGAPAAGGAPTVAGAGVNGGGPWNVTINNNAPGVDVRSQSRPDGGLEVTVERVRAALSQDVMRGGNPFARSLESAYGLGRGR